MLLLFCLESSGYQFQDGIKHPQQEFFFPGRYSNVTPYSSRSKSQRKKWSEAFEPLKVLFLWSVKTIMGKWFNS
jgi:hypothetical protein